MLNKKISQSVLTIGNRCDKPDGGIAQVLYSYQKHIFPKFKHVVNYKRGNIVYKLWITVYAYIQTFLKLLIDREIEIVHIHTASGNGFRRNILFVNLAYIMGKKIVIHIHSGRFVGYYDCHRVQVRKVFSKCSAIVTLSHNFKTFLEFMGEKNVFVINNIIEYPEYKNTEHNDKVLHYLFLGVITKTKGIYDLLDVVKEHQKEFRGKIVLHIGGNKETDLLQTIIKKNNLNDFVIFEGWVNGQKKVKLLNSCDIFILPSYTEGVPISILEAQSYGLFTVATNVGGIPEIVNESNGKLFDPQDKIALYQIMNELNTDKTFLKRKDAIRLSAHKYLPDDVSIQLEAMYRELL